MDYCATIATRAAPDDAARRILIDLDKWWSTRIERHDAGFTVRFNNSHATFAIEDNHQPHRFSWLCTAAHMIIEDVPDRTEWTGTRLNWHVVPDKTGSRITLTHQGLTPRIACFDVCQRGWQHFFETSLRNLLNGDAARPHTDT